MGLIDLNNWRDKAFRGASEKGFHDDSSLSDEHFLSLVVSELGEAIDADRANRRVPKNLTQPLPQDGLDEKDLFILWFNWNYKGTVEEELADAILRLLDLAGLRGLPVHINEDLCHVAYKQMAKKTFTEAVYFTMKKVTSSPFENVSGYHIESSIEHIYGLFKLIDSSPTHVIDSKIEYNIFRPHMHGKRY